MAQTRLTDRQEAFVREYLIDLNATQASIRAGYSPRTANRIASENLSKPDIQQAIASAMQDRNERVEADADYVLRRMMEIDRMDVADILDDDGLVIPVKQWPAIWRQCISSIDVSELWDGTGDQRQLVGVMKKIKWPDKLRNLEIIGKHTKVQCWREKIEHEHSGLPTVILHDPSNMCEE